MFHLVHTLGVGLEVGDHMMDEMYPEYIGRRIESVKPLSDGCVVRFTIGGERETVHYCGRGATLMVARPMSSDDGRALLVLCTSDDPNNHQGDTCPIHEGGA